MPRQGPILTLVIDNGDGTLTATAWAVADAAIALHSLTVLMGKPIGDGLMDTAAVDDTARAAAIALRLEP